MKSAQKKNLVSSLKEMGDEEILRVLRRSNKLRNPRPKRRAVTSTGRRKAPEWTRREEAILGKIPDTEAAQRLGRSFGAVRLHRSRLGIPCHGSPARRFKSWTPEELALLGTLPDRLLATKLRRTAIAVMNKRTQLGIPAKIEGYHRWRPEDEKILGQRPDHYVAKLLGISIQAVQHRRLIVGMRRRPAARRLTWTPEMEALLGTATDEEIARRLGCASTTVAMRRYKLKKPAFVRNWTAEEDALFERRQGSCPTPGPPTLGRQDPEVHIGIAADRSAACPLETGRGQNFRYCSRCAGGAAFAPIETRRQGASAATGNKISQSVPSLVSGGTGRVGYSARCRTGVEIWSS